MQLVLFWVKKWWLCESLTLTFKKIQCWRKLTLKETLKQLVECLHPASPRSSFLWQTQFPKATESTWFLQLWCCSCSSCNVVFDAGNQRWASGTYLAEVEHCWSLLRLECGLASALVLFGWEPVPTQPSGGRRAGTALVERRGFLCELRQMQHQNPPQELGFCNTGAWLSSFETQMCLLSRQEAELGKGVWPNPVFTSASLHTKNLLLPLPAPTSCCRRPPPDPDPSPSPGWLRWAEFFVGSFKGL